MLKSIIRAPIRHREPTDTVKKQILAASGNQCAFVNCTCRIVARDEAVLVGEIAHIKARGVGGRRFDPDQTEEENRSSSNLIALCSEHHTIIDNNEDTYTVENLTNMKSVHEDTIENMADRSWIRPVHVMYQMIGGFTEQVRCWIDRNNEIQIYSARQLAILRTLMDVYQDVNKLCSLYQSVIDNPQAPAETLIQGDTRLNREQARIDEGEQWRPFSQIVLQMAEVPDITFAEFLGYLIQGNDTTELIRTRAEVLENKINEGFI